MITITFPIWYTWLIAILAILLALNVCLYIYMAYLKRKLSITCQAWINGIWVDVPRQYYNEHCDDKKKRIIYVKD